MTKPFLTAAFGCAIVLAGALPAFAARGASPGPSTSGPGGGNVPQLLCLGTCGQTPPPGPSNTLPVLVPVVVHKVTPVIRPLGCGDQADEYGLSGEHYMEFMRKCELTGIH